MYNIHNTRNSQGDGLLFLYTGPRIKRVSRRCRRRCLWETCSRGGARFQFRSATVCKSAPAEMSYRLTIYLRTIALILSLLYHTPICNKCPVPGTHTQRVMLIARQRKHIIILCRCARVLIFMYSPSDSCAHCERETIEDQQNPQGGCELATRLCIHSRVAAHTALTPSHNIISVDVVYIHSTTHTRDVQTIRRAYTHTQPLTPSCYKNPCTLSAREFT